MRVRPPTAIRERIRMEGARDHECDPMDWVQASNRCKLDHGCGPMEVAQAQATRSIVPRYEEDAATRRKLKAETLHNHPKQFKPSRVTAGESSLTMALKPARMKMQDSKLGATSSTAETESRCLLEGNTVEQFVGDHKSVAADSEQVAAAYRYDDFV